MDSMTIAAGDGGQQVWSSVRRDRLVSAALRLMNAPSPTTQAGAALDALADLLQAEGFSVDRPEAGASARTRGRACDWMGRDAWSNPSVRRPSRHGASAVRRSPGCGRRPRPAARFGHEGRRRGGVLEAMLALRDSGLLGPPVQSLFTAHDLHEAPWGFGEQLDELIRAGNVGDAVLIPESLRDHLPVSGRGQACWKVAFHPPRRLKPVHEVMRPVDEPDVLAAGAELLNNSAKAGPTARRRRNRPLAGRASRLHRPDSRRRDLQRLPARLLARRNPPMASAQSQGRSIEAEFRKIVHRLSRESGAEAIVDYQLVRDAFTLDEADPLVVCFQKAHEATSGRRLPTGPKPFVDDGNCFSASAKIAAITHGPKAGGQHTLEEWVSIEDLERVARCYALTALHYCLGPKS